MFEDSVTLRVGGETVKIRRLTIREIREAGSDFSTGKDTFGDEAVKLVKAHCTVASTGKPIEPESLSMPQMRQILNELVGIPEGSPLSDFIGLLC